MRRRRGERGSALILAVLILFAMLGLGLIAMRSTTQNIAGSGNLRLNKQARYVAEAGLYASLAVLNANTLGVRNALLTEWQRAVEAGPAAVMLDDRGRAWVTRVGPDGRQQGAPLFETVTGVPTFLASGPGPLGIYGQTSGLVTSFEVTVEGFAIWGPSAGNEIGDNGMATDGDCLMHLTARGYVANAPVGADGFDRAGDDVRFAEHTLKAGVVLEVDNQALCQAL